MAGLRKGLNGKCVITAFEFIMYSVCLHVHRMYRLDTYNQSDAKM